MVTGLLRAVATLALLLDSYAAAFSFTTDTTTPSTCGSMTFNWTGGSPPFALTIIVRTRIIAAEVSPDLS